MQRLPVSESELQDLARKIEEFEDSLTPDQRKVIEAALGAAVQDAREQGSEGNAVARQLFGDPQAQAELQSFLSEKAGVGGDVEGYLMATSGPVRAPEPAKPVGSLVTITVSIALEC